MKGIEHSTNLTSLEIFRKFVNKSSEKDVYGDDLYEADEITSPECFNLWVTNNNINKKKIIKNNNTLEEQFKRCLSCHVIGVHGCNTFTALEEKAVLKVLRKSNSYLTCKEGMGFHERTNSPYKELLLQEAEDIIQEDKSKRLHLVHHVGPNAIEVFHNLMVHVRDLEVYNRKRYLEEVFRSVVIERGWIDPPSMEDARDLLVELNSQYPNDICIILNPLLSVNPHKSNQVVCLNNCAKEEYGDMVNNLNLVPFPWEWIYLREFSTAFKKQKDNRCFKFKSSVMNKNGSLVNMSFTAFSSKRLLCFRQVFGE